jgi:hypothetical protein
MKSRITIITIACDLIVGSFSLPVPVLVGPVTWAFEGVVSLIVAQTPVRTEDFKLVPGDAEQGFGWGFGFSVAAVGDWIVVGARGDIEGGNWGGGAGAGAVYVFRRDGDEWVQHAKLFAPPGQFERNLGSAVATDGKRIVTAGTDLDSELTPGPGALYVYRRQDGGTPTDLADDQWVFESRIAGESLTEYNGERLGLSVAVQGDVIVGGTTLAWFGLPGRAKVFRFDRDQWVQEALLVGSDTAARDAFGSPVAIAGRTIVVGAPSDDEARREGGAAYVFEWDGGSWAEVTKLRPAANQTSGHLAKSISTTSNLVLLGGGVTDAFLMKSGVVLYERKGREWVQSELLSPATGTSGTDFGQSVAVSSRRILVGAPKDDDLVTDSGSVYVFARQGRRWVGSEKLVPSDPRAGAQFGYNLDLSGGNAVIGGLRFPGAVYVYSMTPFKKK